MSRKVKGMVQLAGVTYRIVRVALGTYSVVRISDDSDVGSFRLPELAVEARSVEPALLREVARLAIHAAKTSSVGLPRPEEPTADTSTEPQPPSPTPPSPRAT